MPGLCDVKDEVLLAILRTGLLDLTELAALARSCRRLKDVAEETLYGHNRDRQGSSAVLWAAVHGNIATLDKALAYKLCINQANQSITIPGRIPLQIAVVHGQDSAVTWFLDHGAKFTRVLPRAPRCKCNNNMTSVLHAAFCFGHASTARLLISRGAPLEYPLPDPWESGNHKTTALLEASFYGLDTIVEVLVKEHGMHPQKHSGIEYYDALAHAARNANNVSMIRLLVSLGADVDGSHKWWPSSPLHIAISGGNFALAHVLLDLGARIFPDEGDVDVHSESTRETVFPTPLHDAIASIDDRYQPGMRYPGFQSYPGFIRVETNDSWRAERIGFVQRLIELGVDVNMKARGVWESKPLGNGKLVYASPLGLAAAQGGATEMAMLIGAGAKVETKMLFGVVDDPRDAWDHIGTDTEARMEKIKLLLNHGAKPGSAMVMLLAHPCSPSSALHEILHMSSPEKLSQEHLDDALEKCLGDRRYAPTSTNLVHHGARVSGEDKLYSIARSLVNQPDPGMRENGLLELDPATSSGAKALHISMGTTIDMGLSGSDQALIFQEILHRNRPSLAHLFLNRGLLSRPEVAEHVPAYLMIASFLGDVRVIKQLWQLPREAPDKILCYYLVQQSIALGNKDAVSFFMRHGADPFQFLTHAQVSRERRLREDATAAQAEAAKIFESHLVTWSWTDSPGCLQARRKFERTQLVASRHGLTVHADAYLSPFLSPLQFAARCGHMDIVSDLLEHVSQADTSAISRLGEVYIPCVLMRANEICEMLQKNGIECE